MIQEKWERKDRATSSFTPTRSSIILYLAQLPFSITSLLPRPLPATADGRLFIRHSHPEPSLAALCQVHGSIIRRVLFEGPREHSVRKRDYPKDESVQFPHDDGEYACLQEEYQRHEGDAHEDHGDCEAPVSRGNREFRNAKDGLFFCIFHKMLVSHLFFFSSFVTGSSRNKRGSLAVTKVSGRKIMLIMVRMRMLSPWSMALLLSLMELPLNNWSLRFSISFLVRSLRFSTSLSSATAFSSSRRRRAIFARYASPSGEEGEGWGQRTGWFPDQKSSVKVSK